MRPLSLLGAFALCMLGAVASFVLTTVVMDQVPDIVLVGVTSLVAAAVLVTLRITQLRDHLRTTPVRSSLMAAVGGIGMLTIAPLIALSQRASDAPSGSETLFFTTAVWGLVAVLVGVLALRENHAAVVIGGALLSLAGAASLLANWERPSSFSPFAKFPVQELWMIVAGVVFVGATIALMRVSRESSMRLIVAVAAGAAGLVALPAVVYGLIEQPQTLTRLSTEFVLLGVAQAAFIVGWTMLVDARGLARSGSVLLTVPVGMSALLVIERATGVFGPIPFQMAGVLAGAAVCMSAAAALWLVGEPGEPFGLSRGLRFAEVLAWIAALVGAISLFRPALNASSVGVLGEGFSATWVMVGAESAVGWLPLAAALTSIGAIHAHRKGHPRSAWVSAVVAVLVAAGAASFLADTTLHTWNRWVPAEVQQTYGTEYARFSVSAIVEPVRTGSFMLVVLSVAVFVVSVIVGGRRAPAPEREET